MEVTSPADQSPVHGWRLEIDPIACDGRGLCAELFPDGIELDDWGFPVLADGAVPEDLRARARQAVRACPTLALRLTRPAGRARISARARGSVPATIDEAEC